MTSLNGRRGFLRGLVSLPLIGGGVTLIGAPTAVAAPVTERLMREYANWIAFEHYRAQIELHGTMDRQWYELHGAAYRWHEDAAGKADLPVQAPSTRAALVLSAVGCDWREGGL
ncbi:hypothetical protein MKL09_07150 [Methylobacterium sp. J-048]|uniref:hypothetical protein n=1 Tax=Methylobacterium sp. J-048 TaxID=2836635 RepID=UPI001FBA1FB7|nr:hypothetical protein [Methylobacterium sp. J-048]MCJ2056324.1 hypothetical protein [Methylobacterium sp. J-048]